MIIDSPENELIQLKETIRLLKVRAEQQSIHFHHLIQFTHTPYVKLSATGLILECNDFAAQLMGEKAARLLQKQFISFIDPAAMAAFNGWFELVYKNRIASALVVKLPGKNGANNQVILQHTEFAAEDCLLIYLSEKDRQAQKIIAEQEDKYKTVIEQAYEGVMIYNLQGVILEFNDKAHHYLGYTQDEFKKLTLSDLFFAEDMIARPIAFNLLTEGKPIIDYRRLKRKDGAGIDMELNSKMMPDGTILVFGRDITARKKDEAERERLSKIVMNSREEIFIVNAVNFQFEYANEAALETLGYTAEELYLLSPVDIKQALAKAALELILAPLKSGQKDKIVFETLQRRKDGTLYPVEVHYQLIDLGHREVYLTITRDITERKNAAIALETREKYFRTLIEHSSSAIVLFDAAGNFIYQSPVVEKIMGYQLEVGVQSNVLTFMHPDDVEAFAENYQDLLQSPGKIFMGQYRFKHSDGHYIWLEGTVTNLLQYEPINALIANYIDVTERKKAEEAARSERSLLRTLIDNLPDPIYVKDNTGKKIIANKEDQLYMGVASEEEVLGKTDLELYPGDVGIRGHQCDQEIMQHGTAVVMKEEQFVDKNNHHHWLLTSKIPLHNSLGETIGLVGIGREITQRKLIADELLKSNERFKYVLKATYDAIWDWDLLTGALTWGENFEKYFGHNPVDGNSNIEHWNEHAHPDDFERVNNSILKTIAGTENNWADQYRFKKQSGEYAFVIDRGIIIRDEAGHALRMIGAMHDITEQKKDEENVKRLNNELAEKAAALTNSNKELEKFAYVASHDLQEPLRMVTSFLGLLEKNCKPVLDEHALTYIRFAVDGASRMKILIQDLLEYSRVSSTNAATGNTDMNLVMREVKELFMITAAELGAKIEVSNLPVLPGTRKMLMVQLMQNLVGNALKYHSKLRPEIYINVAERENDWLFSVADNGIGIDPLYADKIFVIFQRLHTNHEFSGTGIGLSICKKIVEIHGGTIWVSANNTAGSVFNFTIKKNIT
jgi:PAS domain S-box-containing protein